MRKVCVPQIVIFVALWCCNCLASQGPFASEAVTKAIREFVAGLSPAERDEFRKTRREDLSDFHFGAGTKIRERYLSAPNSEVWKAFCPTPDASQKYCYIDNVSGAMIVKVWEQIVAEDN